MKHRGIKFASPVLIATAVGTIVWVNAGQLNPPAGGINPTGPTTLNQQDIGAGPLFSITTSGSYILTSDIVAPGGYTGDGIFIDADNVTLNMNGFALIGAAGPLNSNGIIVTGAGVHRNISIYNGTLRDWGGSGVGGIGAVNSQLRDLRAFKNGGFGLSLGGGTITSCLASGNGSDGIRVNGYSSITGCTADFNAVDGISVFGTNATVTGCVVRQNLGDGIEAATGSNITGCSAMFNAGDGIKATNSLIRGNSSILNTGVNINDGGGTSLLVDNKS